MPYSRSGIEPSLGGGVVAMDNLLPTGVCGDCRFRLWDDGGDRAVLPCVVWEMTLYGKQQILPSAKFQDSLVHFAKKVVISQN